MKTWAKNFVFDIVAAVLFLALGLCGILLPEYGLMALQYLIAAALILYIIFVLFPEIRKARGKLQILVFVELALVFLIALGLVFNSLRILYLGEASQILGLILWLRGVTDICRAYLARGTESAKYYPFWRLLLFILMASFGVFIFAKLVITNVRLVFILSILCFVVALIFVYLMIMALPKKSGTKKQTAKKKS